MPQAIAVFMILLGAGISSAFGAGGRPPEDGAHFLYGSRPIYPDSLRNTRSTGAVAIEYVIDEKGSVVTPRIVSTSHPDFVPPMLRAFSTARFEPALEGGHPVKVRKVEVLWFEPGSELSIVGMAGQHPRIGNHAYGFRAAGSTASGPGNQPVTVRTATNPVYPFESAIRGTTGRAKVEFVVDRDGRPRNVHVLNATAPEFGAALQAMVDACGFNAARENNAAISASMTREQTFSFGSPFISGNSQTRSLLKQLSDSHAVFWTLADLDRRPNPLYNPAPAYPSALDEAVIAGRAEIEFFIDPNGQVQLPRVVAASAPEFGWAGATAVQQWYFDEPMRQGKKVFVRVRVPFEFKPRDRKPEQK